MGKSTLMSMRFYEHDWDLSFELLMRSAWELVDQLCMERADSALAMWWG